MQVEPRTGFTFANALRSMLRHDPDVMMVGEIRDTETAELAVRTSLTGHLGVLAPCIQMTPQAASHGCLT